MFVAKTRLDIGITFVVSVVVKYVEVNWLKHESSQSRRMS